MEPIRPITELNIAEATHEGMTGKHNEDYSGIFAWRVDDQRTLHLGVVADGVGGQTAGEWASRLAVNAVENYFTAQTRLNNVRGHLERAILAANRAVYDYSQANPEYRGMGTTMVLAAVVDGRLYTAYVGDSRIYFLRDGQLHQLSIDHTWAQEAIEAGLLTREQAKTHPNRNVIKRFLGGQPEVVADQRLNFGPAADLAANQGALLQPGDTILLCSDGLSDMIDDPAILDTLLQHADRPPIAAGELIDKANQAGGKDNITAVILQLPGGRPAAGIAPKRSTAAVASTGGRRWGVPLLLVGGLASLVVIAVLIGLFLFLNGRADAQPPTATLTVTAAATPAESTPALPATPLENAATIAVLNTAGAPTDTPAAPTLASTQEVTPTLLPSPTPTLTRVPPTHTPTPSPTPTPSATATATQGAGPPPPPVATSEPVTPTPCQDPRGCP